MSYKGLNNRISLQYSATITGLRAIKGLNVKNLKKSFLLFYEEIRQEIPQVSASFVSKLKVGFQNSLQRIKNSNFPWRRFGKKAGIGALALLAILLIIAGGRKLFSSASGNTSKVEVMGAKASQEINREFSFPLKNDKGEEVNKIKYVIETADLRDEIIVKGQRATAVKGRTFLIIGLKITNEHNQAIQINSRDYIRLILNGNEGELLAPDIHNDPVEVQAISTKLTRVGFPINDSDRALVLLVGEINADKQKIPLELD